MTGKLPAPGSYEHAERRSLLKSSKASMKDLCNVNDICWSEMGKREPISSMWHGGSMSNINEFNGVVRHTRPIQTDADPAVFDSIVIGIVAIRLAHHQLVSEVLVEMNHTPDFTHAGGFQSLLMIVKRHLHYSCIV